MYNRCSLSSNLTFLSPRQCHWSFQALLNPNTGKQLWRMSWTSLRNSPRLPPWSTDVPSPTANWWKIPVANWIIQPRSIACLDMIHLRLMNWCDCILSSTPITKVSPLESLAYTLTYSLVPLPSYLFIHTLICPLISPLFSLPPLRFSRWQCLRSRYSLGGLHPLRSLPRLLWVSLLQIVYNMYTAATPKTTTCLRAELILLKTRSPPYLLTSFLLHLPTYLPLSCSGLNALAGPLHGLANQVTIFDTRPYSYLTGSYSCLTRAHTTIWLDASASHQPWQQTMSFTLDVWFSVSYIIVTLFVVLAILFWSFPSLLWHFFLIAMNDCHWWLPLLIAIIVVIGMFDYQEVLSWIQDLQKKFEKEGREVNKTTITEFAWEVRDVMSFV